LLLKHEFNQGGAMQHLLRYTQALLTQIDRGGMYVRARTFSAMRRILLPVTDKRSSLRGVIP
jgi:hypothetical protein